MPCGGGTLRIIFPTLYARTRNIGYFLLQTGSRHDIANLSAALVNLAGLSLDILPFRLGREDKPIGWRTYKDRQSGQEKTARVVKSLLYLHPSDTAAETILRDLAARTGLALMPGLFNI